VRQVRDPLQANTRGAALVAAAGLGQISFQDVAKRVEIAREYHPDPKHRRVYDDRFCEFVNVYRKTRGLYHRLNAHHV
jgi:xylulokinase